MKGLPFVIILFFPLLLHGQYIGICSTSFFTDFSKPNAYFNSLQTVSGNSAAALRNPMTGIGIEHDAYLFINRLQTYAADVSLEFIFPQGFHDNNDSLYFFTSGFHFTTCILGWRMIKKEHMDLILGPGLNAGRLKIKRSFSDGSKAGAYENGFFSPMIRMTLKYYTGKTLVSLRAFYRYDLTKPGWDRYELSLPVIPQLYWTGFGFQIAMGFAIK